LPETQGNDSLPGVLSKIVRAKRAELERLRGDAAVLERAIGTAPSVRDFRQALSGAGHVSLIAECKRRSPGAGPIRPDLDPLELTVGYERAGAAALSVLTDGTFFGGSNDDLTRIRSGVELPILRKDFTLDPLHVIEARGAGADAILLIVRILSDRELRALYAEAIGLGMSVLVEVHDEQELRRALAIDANIVGVNNRDLATFTTDLQTTLKLLDDIPGHVLVVSESGIRDQSDVVVLGEAGVDAILVGEALLRAPEPWKVAGTMSAVPRRARDA
jgi:indole-3-glycerol phosphate synthase